MHFIAEAWILITLTAIKNCFAQCGGLVDHVYDNDSSEVKLTENEENDWHI
jgi:hypothetical protein